MCGTQLKNAYEEGTKIPREGFMENITFGIHLIEDFMR